MQADEIKRLFQLLWFSVGCCRLLQSKALSGLGGASLLTVVLGSAGYMLSEGGFSSGSMLWVVSYRASGVDLRGPEAKVEGVRCRARVQG